MFGWSVQWRVVSLVGLLVAPGCGGCGDDKAELDDFLPEIPAPTGDPQSVFAGQVTDPSQLVTGPAQSGVVGDFFIRNTRAHFIIQSADRLIGAVPQGGNLIDAVRVEGGAQASDDHFGELSLIYVLGRTCEHESIDVVQDGSGGGVAAIVARGKAAPNDFISIRGFGLFAVDESQNPDRDDEVECATTYILAPDSDRIEIYWTLFNPSGDDITGPFGAYADTGGVVKSWSPSQGFAEAGIDSIAGGGDKLSVQYAVYQGPDVAYGLLPRHDDPTIDNASVTISGISILLYGATGIVDILRDESFFLDLPAKDGVTHGMNVSVGRDAADAERNFLEQHASPSVQMSGSVALDTGGPAVRARVGVFTDDDGDGQIGPDDTVISYFDVDDQGAFAGQIRPGNYLLRADVLSEGRSPALPVNATGDATNISLTVPAPVEYDYNIVDDDSGSPIPAKLTVIGRSPAIPDERVHPTSDFRSGLVNMIYSTTGTTGAGEPPIRLPAGTSYRVLASRGTEWSVASALVTANPGDPISQIDLSLRQVAPAVGYLSSEYHVHSIDSPDSIVSKEARIKSALVEGIELFASTDHDFVSVFQPLIETLGVAGLVRSISGIEVTPFAYGHFNAWPIEPILELPNNGGIDWARNENGFSLIPTEIFAAMRDRGAELVEVNHPRSAGGLTDFQQYFDRADLVYDYDNRVVGGDQLGQPVPNDFLRLPEGAELFDPNFNALEVWNGFSPVDTNDDGVREITKLDVVMRDWFNFLSFGMQITPVGNSDTHQLMSEPMGMPRTYVRVADDSAAALSSGSAVADVLDTLAGRQNTPIDVVVTNGPQIEVTVNGDAQPLGKVFDGGGGSIDVEITVTAADWAEFDTIEIFANATPDLGPNTVLEPLACFTNRPGGEIMASDPCALAPLGGAQSMTVQTVQVAPGFDRFEATVSLTIDVGDVVTRAGGTGTDAWFVVRTRGDRAVFPVMLDGVLDDANIDTFVGSADPNDLDPFLFRAGIPASAFTAPFYVDFDGGGYRAPFSP